LAHGYARHAEAAATAVVGLNQDASVRPLARRREAADPSPYGVKVWPSTPMAEYQSDIWVMDLEY